MMIEEAIYLNWSILIFPLFCSSSSIFSFLFSHLFLSLPFLLSLSLSPFYRGGRQGPSAPDPDPFGGEIATDLPYLCSSSLVSFPFLSTSLSSPFFKVCWGGGGPFLLAGKSQVISPFFLSLSFLLSFFLLGGGNSLGSKALRPDLPSPFSFLLPLLSFPFSPLYPTGNKLSRFRGLSCLSWLNFDLLLLYNVVCWKLGE